MIGRFTVNSTLLFIPLALLLAWEPTVWLVHTWKSPAYDSDGGYIFLLALGIFLWSVTSRVPSAEGSSPNLKSDQKAWRILVATAIARAIGNSLAISVVGAFALAFDVYAFGRLARLNERKRRVSPAFLALVFAFSLPVERIVQRVVGYGLQYFSALGSCGVLKLTHEDVICEGTKITLDTVPVLVDLPCSGARGLTLILLFWAATCALRSPKVLQAIAALGTAVVGAILSNILRITVLAVGIAHGDSVGIDVMAQPWHDIIGLIALGVGVLPIALISSTWHKTSSVQAPKISVAASVAPPSKFIMGLTAVTTVVALALVPPRPVDVSREVAPVTPPRNLLGTLGNVQGMSELERNYFQSYGGAASKTTYDDVTLLMVRTSSPLRHLHAPDECMRGAGYEVDRLGVESTGAMPSAVYRATSPSSEVLVVYVTYIGSNGKVASSISEAVYEWMKAPNTTWTAYERAFDSSVPEASRHAFDRALLAKLNLKSTYPN